ncbi:pyoverdine dityrosine biosynthesis [Chlorella sorokiniana]|uniref:Pyoverdine dityrosine biosynthesis n=1 Tax=Chlorella sorokiniana TaxID=3076 RepID=A0A2P6TQB5_CHLSO|nr:pyoverdine dityrosine biosynthesis [Chlorella sorokiniana]|eukprot:PRW56231.1 pyoverdine dityrosine biosynthesis [Chlorella sorokiniana]
MEVDAREVAEAVRLLAPEFPDASASQLESVLRECGCDISAARRRLYELQEAQQLGGGSSTRPSSAAVDESPTAKDDDDWGWGGFNQGMRDLGLEQLGAQLSLFGRQVASSISSLLPAELNPFGPDEEEVEEYEAAVRAKAAADAQRERETAAVTKEARHLQSRRHGGGGGSGTSSRQRSYSPEAPQQPGEAGEEDYDDKLE